MSLHESIDRVCVTVTFLRMGRPPAEAAPPLPPEFAVRIVRPCPLKLYRRLYDTVGADYLWWLRRTMPDAQLAALLADPAVCVHVLEEEQSIAGFYELDAGAWPVMNLSYFGLMPDAVGTGIGHAFLRHAVDAAWGRGCTALTVNTCTADHPRALPTYLRAGFKETRHVREQWDVPVRLGLRVAERLNPVRFG